MKEKVIGYIFLIFLPIDAIALETFIRKDNLSHILMVSGYIRVYAGACLNNLHFFLLYSSLIATQM